MRCSLISYYISEQLRKIAHYIVLVLRMCLCGVGTYVSISMKFVMQSHYELMTLPVQDVSPHAEVRITYL